MYQLTNGPVIIRLSDGASIPDDPRNTDRQIYNDWVLAGGVALPA